MEKFPILETERLTLSEITSADIPAIVGYLQEKVISDNTCTIPYPYTEEHAVFWLKLCKEAFEKKQGWSFAIRNKNNDFLGAIGLHDKDDHKAEIGYWMGLPHWNKGLTTEAVKRILVFGFSNFVYNEIYGDVYTHNLASGMVLVKSGMTKQGVLKDHVKKEDQSFDLIRYSILKDNFSA